MSLKKSYRDLKVWQNAIALTKATYLITENFPKREHYGLAQQMRRSAVSVASNIAEGAARHTDKDYAHFLVMARGSLAELTTQSIIAYENSFITAEDQQHFEAQADEVSRMLNGLKSKLTTND